MRITRAEPDFMCASWVSEDPEGTWERIRQQQVFAAPPEGFLVSSASGWTQQPAGSVRCVCISDTHSQHERVDVPPGDILIHAGDFTMCGASFEVEEFAAWLKGLPHAQKAHTPCVVCTWHTCGIRAAYVQHVPRARSMCCAHNIHAACTMQNT